jgi:hypothetical protein
MGPFGARYRESSSDCVRILDVLHDAARDAIGACRSDGENLVYGRRLTARCGPAFTIALDPAGFPGQSRE